jgi:hypothetical protein
MPDSPQRDKPTRPALQRRGAEAAAQESLEKARAELENRLDEIAASLAGRPQPDVLDALERAVTKAGVTPERADLSALARRISQTPATDR